MWNLRGKKKGHEEPSGKTGKKKKRIVPFEIISICVGFNLGFRI